MSDFVPWGDDAHRAVVEFLPWPDNGRLACGNMALHNAMAKAKKLPPWWEQAQSTAVVPGKIVESFVKAAETLTPSARPNFSMLMVEIMSLRETTLGDLCGRLHSANLVPMECPIFVVKGRAGVFGAGVQDDEGHYSVYESRDIELDPPPPVTAVLTVAYIPPEETSGGPVSRVSCFLVDKQTQCYRYDSYAWPDGVTPAWTERAPSRSRGAVSRAARSSSRDDAEPAGGPTPRTLSANKSGRSSGGKLERRPSSVGASGKCSAGLWGQGDSSNGRGKPGKQQPPLRRSSRTSTMADSKARSSRRPRPELSGPSTSVPLEKADTFFLMGTDEKMLTSTTEWLKRARPEAVILGGKSECALVVGDQEFRRDNLGRQPSTHGQMVVGVGLKGVHALALSAAGFEGMGPVFRVDETIDSDGEPQAEPGRVPGNVSVVSEGGLPSSRPTTAHAIWFDLFPESVDVGGEWEVYGPALSLGVGSCPKELLRCRPFSTLDDDPDREGDGEATGETPMEIPVHVQDAMGFGRNVVPGQYARFMGSTPELCLADTEAIYRNCRQRIKRIGGVVLSSIHFTCAGRNERLEVLDEDQQLAGGGRVIRVESLYQQEIVRFCKTFNAPAAGVFCFGELGPVPTMIPGIVPKTAPSTLRTYTSCTAILWWNPELSQTD